MAPWHSEDRVRSWVAIVGAADARFTLELVKPLKQRALHTLLLWGVEDEFQPLRFAERYASEYAEARLVLIEGASHIPAHDDPAGTGRALADFFA